MRSLLTGRLLEGRRVDTEQAHRAHRAADEAA